MSLENSDLLLAGIDDEHSSGLLLHLGDTAHELLKLLYLELELDNFLLGKHIESSVSLHGLELLKSLYTALNGVEVGEHTAEPTGVDIRHAAALSLLADRILSLLLRADEKDLLAVCSDIADRHIGILKLLDRLLKVDDVNTVALRENIGSHFGVPSSGLMTEVHTCFKQLLH